MPSEWNRPRGDGRASPEPQGSSYFSVTYKAASFAPIHDEKNDLKLICFHIVSDKPSSPLAWHQMK
jgi:hypothetical protein